MEYEPIGQCKFLILLILIMCYNIIWVINFNFITFKNEEYEPIA